MVLIRKIMQHHSVLHVTRRTELIPNKESSFVKQGTYGMKYVKSSMLQMQIDQKRSKDYLRILFLAKIFRTSRKRCLQYQTLSSNSPITSTISDSLREVSSSCVIRESISSSVSKQKLERNQLILKYGKMLQNQHEKSRGNTAKQSLGHGMILSGE